MVMTGTKYEATKDLDAREITKMIRADIKAATKAGQIQDGTKVSVRLRRYAGGQSIDVVVKQVPFQVHPVAWLDWGIDPETRHSIYPSQLEMPRYTLAALSLRARLEGILASYNRDASDPMTDYYNTRFYSFVSFDAVVTAKERDEREKNN